jgi:hypothetical protein
VPLERALLAHLLHPGQRVGVFRAVAEQEVGVEVAEGMAVEEGEPQAKGGEDHQEVEAEDVEANRKTEESAPPLLENPEEEEVVAEEGELQVKVEEALLGVEVEALRPCVPINYSIANKLYSLSCILFYYFYYKFNRLHQTRQRSLFQ